jgi:fructose-1,6-bisphosphatase
LDESIERIAKQIDKQTLKNSYEKLENTTFEDDKKEMEIFIDEYLEEINQKPNT